MRLKLVLGWLLVLIPSLVARDGETFEESLWIKALPSGHIHTRLEFRIQRLSPSEHFTLFPRTLWEILSAHEVQELQLSLTQGHWRLETWGDPHPAQMAPTGAHVVAWFTTNSTDPKTADADWRGLTNRLSGLTCASLNFLDETTSIEPKFAYRPVGSWDGKGKPVHVRVGALPREFICTENLTPWTKLLPCGIMRGIASLLRSKQVFNTHYHSAKLVFAKNGEGSELRMSLSLVFDKPSSSNNQGNDNFLKTVVGSLAIFPCHVAKKTEISIWNKGVWDVVAPEQLNAIKLKSIPKSEDEPKALVFTPVKYLGGYGQEYGKMVVEMTNHLADQFISVLYVEVLPWYVRPYLHTMNIEVSHGEQNLPVPKGKFFHYTPGRDRKALHKLEMDLSIPPKAKVTLSFMVEKGHLKWDEYPPDANHGFYLEAAHFEVNLTKADKEESSTRHYYSRILLINLSTPDFSMPYNVICLTCTVVALAFGPIHNITTKRLIMQEMTKESKLKKVLCKLKLDKYFPSLRNETDSSVSEKTAEDEAKSRENSEYVNSGSELD